MANYKIKGKTTNIHFVSRASIKIKEHFYTIEYGEDRQVDNEVDLEKERMALIDDCNAIVDEQVNEIYKNLQ